MPEAGQQPDNGNIAELLCKAASVAAQRNIDIIPEPCSHRDMPAPPEVGDAVCQKWIVEVFEKPEAQHPPQTDGHVGIAGKVKIEPKPVRNHTQPRSQHRGGRLNRCGLPKQPDVVRQQHLFRDAADKTLHARSKQIGRAAAVLQFVRDCLVADDGTRDELWEQGHIRAEIDDIFLRFRFAPVDIDGVTHGLERIETDADGQRQVRLWDRRTEN